MALAGQVSRRDQIPRGILFMVVSTVLFAGVNAIVKWEVASYPVGEVAFIRSAVGLFPLYAVILSRTGIGVLRTSRLGDHVKRALSQLCSMIAMFMAFQLMPLASAAAISFASPLFTTLLSILILKDKVGPHRWAALAVGFLGVLLITHPGAGSFNVGVVFALINAVMVSTVAIAIRRMSATESTETLSLYQLSFLTLFTAGLLPFGFAWPTWGDAILLTLAGLGNGAAQYCWTKSLHLAPPSAIVPFNYLSLVWASIVGFVVWGDVPTPELILGTLIVVGSGLYILWRETVVRRRAARAAD